MADIQALKDLLKYYNPSFYDILEINTQDQAGIEKFIDDLDDSKNSGKISQDNQKKIDTLYSFAKKVYAMNVCFEGYIDDAIYGKEIFTMKQKFPNLGSTGFLNDIIVRSNDIYNNLLETKCNEYLEIIYDKLGISDAEKVNFDSLNNDDTVSISEKLEIIGKLVKVIDFIEGHQSDVIKNKSTKNNITDIRNLLITPFQPNQTIIYHFNDVYNDIKQNLIVDLQQNYDSLKLNGITEFDKIKFINQNGEIGDSIYTTGFNNINHPMKYLLDYFDQHRGKHPNDWGKNKENELVDITEDADGYPTIFDGKKYRMGENSSLDLSSNKGVYLNHLTGSLDNNGTKINIGHDEGKNVSPLAFQASINATVKSMNENFGKYSKDPQNFQFNLKLNSLSYATCQTMFKELANYAKAQQAQQAATQATPLPQEQIDYNERFKHFKEIFINGVKLEKSLFTANYTNPNKNSQFDEDMFVEAVWNKIESTLKAKQQQPSNGNTSVQLTEQEQIMQDILQNSH